MYTFIFIIQQNIETGNIYFKDSQYKCTSKCLNENIWQKLHLLAFEIQE